MRSQLVLFCFLLASHTALAESPSQENIGIIQGTVVDAQSGEPLGWATVEIVEEHHRISADAQGGFRFAGLNPGTYSVRVGYVGYESRLIEGIDVIAGEISPVVIELVPKPVTLKSIVVSPGSYTIMGTEPTVHQTFSREEITTFPQLGDDLFRSVIRLPGTGGNDFSTRFEIRGGEYEEVLVRLDGLELYEPFHMKDFDGGCLSVIDAAAVNEIELTTGGFPAKYGDKMSGVFNIRSRTVPPGKTRISAGMSLMNLRALAEGSFGNGRGSWLVSARRGFMDIVLNLVSADTSMNPRFYDFFAKTTYMLNSSHMLSFDCLHAHDNYDYIDSYDGAFSDTLRSGYGDTHFWLNLNSIVNPRLSAQTLIATGRSSHERRGREADDNFDLPGRIVGEEESSEYLALKTDWQYEANDRFLFEFGAESRGLRADYDYSGRRFTYDIEWRDGGWQPYVSQIDTTMVTLQPHGTKLGAYLSSRFLVGDLITIETGWRYDYASYTHDYLASLRLGMVYQVNSQTSVHAAWGNYYQIEGIHEISAVDGENEFYPAQKADHYVIGLEHQFPTGTDFRLETYYKTYSSMRPDHRNSVSRIEMFPEFGGDRQTVYREGSVARGIEAHFKRDLGGKLSWYASYAYARVQDSVKAIYFPASQLMVPYDRMLPSPRDIRHALYLDIIYRPGSAWQFNLAFQYHTGWTYTGAHLVRVENPPGVIINYVVPNQEWSSRYAPFHRLDFRLNRFFTVGRGRLSVFFEVLNVYARENVRTYGYFVDPEGRLQELPDEYWFGIMPTLGVSYDIVF